MKIFLVSGAFWRGSLEWSCKRILKDLNHKTKTFNYRKDVDLSEHGISLFRKARIFLKLREMNKNLIKKTKVFKPDLILILKGEYIFPKTIRKLKSFGPVFNWNPDDPFDPKNATTWMRNVIRYFDCYFIWDKHLIPKLKKHGAKRVEFLPFGYDSEIHHPVKLSKKDKKKYGCDVCFIGTWEPEREKYLSELTEFDLKIWGNGWQKVKGKLKNHIKGKAIYTEEFCKAICASKINLNFLREQNKNSHNMRTFEIPACGGFQLTTRSPFHQKIFGEGEGIACFGDGNIKEIKKKIEYYLNRSKEREKIAKKGNKKTINRNSYIHRIKKIINIGKDVQNEK